MKSQFIRARRLSSDIPMQRESEIKIKKQLRENHYPEPLIEEAMVNAATPKRRRRINQHSAFLKLPFKSDRLHHSINKLIRRYKIPVRLVYEHTGSLKKVLCHSALGPPMCLKAEPEVKRRGRPRAKCLTCMLDKRCICKVKNIIYQIECKVCHKLYIGETGRALETRVQEHNSDARRKVQLSPWGQHFRNKHPRYIITADEGAFASIKVVAREQDRARRKLREAVEIRARKPEVNISAGWSLL